MASKENIYSSIQNLYNMDKNTWQEVLAEFYNLIYDSQSKFEQIETKFNLLFGEEVTHALKEMYNDGSLGELINDVLLSDINTNVENFKVEVNGKVDNFKLEVNEQLDNIVNKQFTKNVLYVDKETGQFKTITSAINYAKENNVGKNNRYSIFINNGTYNENLTLDDGIDLYANDKNVIITFSANGFRNGDTLYAPYDCYLKGLTVIQDATSTTEDLQNYSIHIDGRIGDFTLILEDCVFKAIGEWSHHALGAGLHGGQYIIVKNCEFHSDGKPAFYMHNWNMGEITGTKVTLKNTNIYGCKVVDKSSNNYGLLLEDVGSMQTDEIKIEGCEIATLQANGTDICLKKHSGFTGVRNSIIVKLLNSDYRNFSDEIDSGKIITDKDIIAIKSGNIEYGKCCSVLNNNNGILEVNQTAFAESEHCLGLWIPYSGIYGAIRTQGITKGFVNADSGVIAKFDYLTSNSDGSLKKGVVGSGKCFAIALDNFTSGQGYIDVMLVNRC